MTMIPCTNPQLCGVSEHRPGTPNVKCQSRSSMQTPGVLSQTPALLSAPSPSQAPTRRSPDLEKYIRVSEEIDRLEEESPYLGYFKIRKLKAELQSLESIKALAELTMKDDAFHQKYPNAPEWSHSGNNSSDIEKDMYWLYEQKRDFEIVMGRQVGHSPDQNRIASQLSHRKLSASDQATLRGYVTGGKFRDDVDSDSVEWKTQQEYLDDLLSRAPKMDDPATVWRGERYRARGTGSNQVRLERIRYLTELKPGQEFRWDQPISTSTALSVAAITFSNSVGKTGRGVQPDVELRQPDFDYGFVFELETDRGIYVDTDALDIGDNEDFKPELHENEVLVPSGLKFEVVGHAQVRDCYPGSGSANVHESLHVIKLRLIPDQ